MLIGLNGQLGSGKDTVYERAKEVIPRYNEEMGFPQVPISRVSFADKLKDSAAALFDAPRELIEAYKNDQNSTVTIELGNGVYVRHLTIREMLQRYGTESHRDVFGDDFWVNQALREVSHNGALVFVTDVRFPNEVEGIRKLAGHLWKVIGPNDTDAPTHASEQILPDDLFQATIMNKIRDDDYASLDATIIMLLQPYLDSIGQARVARSVSATAGWRMDQ